VAAPHIRARDEAIIVEGYFDVLALHDAGIKNVVAALGVAVSAEHLERAARLCDSRRVVLALDADTAGTRAVDQLCDDVLPGFAADAGVDVRIAPPLATTAGAPDDRRSGGDGPPDDGETALKDAADFVRHHRLVLGWDDARLRAHFQAHVVDAAVPWTHRRDANLLGPVFAPGVAAPV